MKREAFRLTPEFGGRSSSRYGISTLEALLYFSPSYSCAIGSINLGIVMGSQMDLDDMNLSTVCEPETELEWRDAKVIASFMILSFINVVVIVGNCLVILAVFISTKLRTVTNLFIVSLAVADLMVGLAVLPFSATWEIFGVWIFGEIWCSMWLAVDVWMCTASILNLCAISLDRYVAVTRPVTYPSIMSSKKAKLLIGAVWVLSFLICFPPLVGWNDRKRKLFKQLVQQPNTTSSLLLGTSSSIMDSFEQAQMYPQQNQQFSTSKEGLYRGYVVYSAIGSFFLPMFVMLFFYWRIYRAAVETTRAINQGFRTTKGSRLLGSRFEEQRLTLRIHRGRSVQNHHGRTQSNTPKPISPNGRLHHSSSSRIPRSRSLERIKVHLTPPPPRGKTYIKKVTFYLHCVHYTPIPVMRTLLDHNKKNKFGSHNESESSTPSPSPTLNANRYEQLNSNATEDSSKPKLISKMGKRNIKAQVKRFRMETKAAKTLGIIVGGFIVCWLPFFTMYVIRAFCADCIHPLLFSVLFWLGYCNSALNPCIYALFSKDFRFAFKRILCRCICQCEKKPPPQVVPIFLSSLGDESDGNNEPGSDSR
ncbi:putative G-protein coupled receptor No9 [Orchesella cincta]|uniref:Putative G-protein coupled receptor No9 n=1 Tax=Orchesella cincta TaxID=48709 RepID=A0A1D2MSS3_ORCCI|nr:putative G-protein coupled receptor No9 [Orchesella cincta]